MKELSKREKEELQKLTNEITQEAKNVVEDYVKNPSEISGSVVQIHEDSPFIDERLPDGKGWKKVVDEAKGDGIDLIGKKEAWDVPSGILCMVLGCFFIYSILFSIGYLLYSEYTYAIILLTVSIVSLFFLQKAWKRLKMN